MPGEKGPSTGREFEKPWFQGVARNTAQASEQLPKHAKKRCSHELICLLLINNWTNLLWGDTKVASVDNMEEKRKLKRFHKRSKSKEAFFILGATCLHTRLLLDQIKSWFNDHRSRNRRGLTRHTVLVSFHLPVSSVRHHGSWQSHILLQLRLTYSPHHFGLVHSLGSLLDHSHHDQWTKQSHMCTAIQP